MVVIRLSWRMNQAEIDNFIYDLHYYSSLYAALLLHCRSI